MIGRLSSFKWTDKSEHSRDLIFIIIILAFGIVLVAKLAPYYQDTSHTTPYTEIRTLPSTPKEFLEKVSPPTPSSQSRSEGTRKSLASTFNPEKVDRNVPSIIERPLFDGQSVILRVRTLNPYSSIEQNQPLEVQVLGPFRQRPTNDLDFSFATGGKLVGTGSANFSVKRLYLSFSNLITREGRSYAISAQAIDPETLASGIEGDYSSGLPTRLLGIALDRTIMAADQVGTAYLFSSIGPKEQGPQEFKKAAMETNQQASQNIAAEATRSLRETPPEITLPPGSEFYVRVQSSQHGGTK